MALEVESMKRMSVSSSDNNYSTFTVNLKFVVILFIIIIGFPGNSKAIKKDLPFYPGEKLTYQLKWDFIPAGEAVLEVLPIKTINNVQSYHFAMTVKTNSFVNIFYKIRERIDAYTNIEVTRSILYKEEYIAGKSQKNVVVNFDWENKKAQYSNLGKKRKPISILPGSFDPLSVFYYTRLIDPKENGMIERPVTDGKKCVIGQAKVIKREIIKLESGTYDTYLIEPVLKDVGGVIKESKNAKIKLWVSADKRRIPVKIKSKLVVGSFVGELVSAK